MPMDESSAPMVVGARQTRSATRLVMEIAVPAPACLLAKAVNGRRVPETTRKMIVSVTSRICSAISFGVFLREAPSTMAIILSRKLSPRSAVMRMTSQSERTVVPPVTALRSPPDSRMTGADSPVMALSSTEAAPSITSPSIGICSPAMTETMSPFFRSAERISVKSARLEADFSFRARTSFLALRRVFACALPRPSAMASAKLANSTVNQRISAMASV
ncbi:hypothetical protein SDC9_168868 [bioreactor metagenome]|uniref:Uncharacterized protein n=1 Tax=bioreactor metagenome TaxID=1076179 RepID=A0A645G3P9_9ZZZZ